MRFNQVSIESPLPLVEILREQARYKCGHWDEIAGLSLAELAHLRMLADHFECISCEVNRFLERRQSDAVSDLASAPSGSAPVPPRVGLAQKGTSESEESSRPAPQADDPDWSDDPAQWPDPDDDDYDEEID